MLFLAVCGGHPVAFLFGYDGPSDGATFFLDTVATLVEGKGVGSTFVSLALLYCYEVG